MAKNSGGTRNGTVQAPQFAGVSNTSKQVEHVKGGSNIAKLIESRLGVNASTANQMKMALEEYTGGQFDKIRNEQARTGGGAYANKLEEFIDKSPKWHGGTTYRGVRMTEDSFNNMKVGDVISQHGLSSWSTNKDVSSPSGNLATPVSVTFKCDYPQNGTSIKGYSKKKGEDEILVSGKARHKVISINDDGYKYGYHRYTVTVKPTKNGKAGG